VVARLRELLVNATKAPAAKAFFEGSGAEAWTTSSDELGKYRM